jgi:cytochrome c peroxidase
MRSLFAAAVAVGFAAAASANPPELTTAKDPYDAALPNDALMEPFKDAVPVTFVTRPGNPALWAKLAAFWSETTEDSTDPVTGAKLTRRAIAVKVPLGLSTAPVSPAENPLTLSKWNLGKKLYYDKLLSTNGTVACASCHAPEKGFTDQRETSLGINEKLGGMNAPTVVNSGLNRHQFWDGRADSLEAQAQGPVGNPLEMFGGKGEPWDEAVIRMRANPEYVEAFKRVFGHLPTRDAAAKAIAAYERTVLSGNSVHDRADLLMRKRVQEEETGKFELKGEDYAAALTDAFARKDAPALTALGLDPARDAGRAAEVGSKLAVGRDVFFGKARCTNCHIGDNFTDGLFHNLGVGTEAGKVPGYDFGRYNRLALGAKDPAQLGAFKTPGLRALAGTFPYMHDGAEATLEKVVEFYDRGGNANEFLDAKMRDVAAEDAYVKAKATGGAYAGPAPALFARGGRPVIPFKLNLTPDEKAALVLFLKALQGDPIDPVVADPARFSGGSQSRR